MWYEPCNYTLAHTQLAGSMTSSVQVVSHTAHVIVNTVEPQYSGHSLRQSHYYNYLAQVPSDMTVYICTSAKAATSPQTLGPQVTVIMRS